MKAYPGRFALIYALLALAPIAGAVLCLIVLNLPTPLQVAHKSDLGYADQQSLVTEAEVDLAHEATSEGLTVIAMRPYSVRVDGNTAWVVIAIHFVDPVGIHHHQKVSLRYQKGVWALTSFKSA